MIESSPDELTEGAIRVLFVEDDKEFRQTVSDELSKRGFLFRCFRDGASLLASLAVGVDAHIIILGWHLPKMLSVDLLPTLRRHGVNLPVVFLTGHTLPANESLALERGATDFIDRARGIDVLVRRLVRIREASKSASDVEAERTKKYGKLSLRLDVGRAYWAGTDVGLTKGEYSIVCLLTSNVGEYFTYRALYDQLRHEGFETRTGRAGYHQNVRSVIRRIRKKFSDLNPTFDEIENFVGFGYCWKKAAEIGDRPELRSAPVGPEAVRKITQPNRPASYPRRGLRSLWRRNLPQP